MIKRLAINLFGDFMLLVLAADELLLYYQGAWTDPIRLILVAELACLYGFIVFAIWRIFYHIRRK